MRITFDPEADAVYIEIKSGNFAKTETLDNYETMLDIDKGGSVMGIELLNVSHRFPASFVDQLKSGKRPNSIPVEILV